MRLTAKQRIEYILQGKSVDRVPFTVYENKIPRCEIERKLRNMGLCIIDRTIDVISTHYTDIQETQTHYSERSNSYMRVDYHTHVGPLSMIYKKTNASMWCEKHLFSEPEDYKKLRYFVNNTYYEANYSAFATAQERAGDDVFFRGSIGSEPLQTIVMWMGSERFCYEWMDRRDEVLALYNALVSAARRRYKLLADSPAFAFNYGGNVITDVIGPDVFKQFYVPNYNEAAEILHKAGKVIGSHFDGNCKLIAELIAQSQLDYVEAFSPAPDTDMTLQDALNAWPDKCLWVNFPSSMHLTSSVEEIGQTTREMLEVSREKRFILGVTEDVPEDRWQQTFPAIMNAMNDYYDGN